MERGTGSPARGDTSLRSSDWLARLPDGEEKRRFILDCTGCHQFDGRITLPGGRPRTQAEWTAAVQRMLGYAGATTGFPVISSYRDPERTAAWLATNLAKPASSASASSPSGGSVPAAEGRGEVTEFPMPEPTELPRDLQVDGEGRVVITGMFTHRMYSLDPASGRMDEFEIPEEKANPRAVEIAPNGVAGRWSGTSRSTAGVVTCGPRTARRRAFRRASPAYALGRPASAQA